MKADIETVEDVELLIDNFYEKAREDDLIGFIFSDHMDVSFEEHLPIIYSFWQSVLLVTASYKGNVMLKHIALHKKVTLVKSHFKRWLLLWEAAVDNTFEGAVAEEAKKRAHLMKELMLVKIKHSMGDGFIQ